MIDVNSAIHRAVLLVVLPRVVVVTSAVVVVRSSFPQSVATTAEPEEYARLVDGAIKDFVRHDGPKYLAKARVAATREQKVALAKVSGSRVARRR